MSFLFRRKPPKAPPKPFDFSKNIYKAHTRWPPIFADLTQKEQFRFERKFRRRSKLKWARPKWNRNLQLVQWGGSVFIIAYAVFFLDWRTNEMQKGEPEGKPWYSDLGDSFWSKPKNKSTASPAANEVTPPRINETQLTAQS